MKGKMKCYFTGIIFALTTGLLAGCAPALPELSESDEAQIVEYASGLLLKYDKNYQSSLLSLEEVGERAAEAALLEAAQDAEDAETAEAVSETDNSNVSGDVASGDETIAEELPVLLPLTDVMAIGGIDFQYAGYETADEYPSEVESGEIYFMFNASENSKLLVLKFDATNYSDAEVYLDMTQSDLRFKIGWNGGETRNALITMLLNDISTYRGTIAAGETVQLVTVCEIPEESESTIGSVELQVRIREGEIQDILL